MSFQTRLSVEKVLVDDRILKNQTVIIEDGTIQSIEDELDSNISFLKGTLVPGFIDIQVNGGGGCLFNDSPSLESIQTIAKAHQKFGTTGWLPTLITDSIEKMKLAADAVAVAKEQSSLGVLGIHFEGPHISSVKKGVHLNKYIRQLTSEEKEIYFRKDLGKVIVTLAPEKVAQEVISELVHNGVIVCLGHSNASFEQTQKALDAGASGFTHLFNAMSQFNSREPGMVGAALASREAYYGLILDGAHVHSESSKLALKMNSNMMLVTDAMPTVGSNENQFEYFGESINLKNNALLNSEGRLAGSNLNMAVALSNCISTMNLELKSAIQFSSFNAAKFLNSDSQYGSLAKGKVANMVLLDQENKVVSCWINGNKQDK